MSRRLEQWLLGGALLLVLPYWLAWSWIGPVTNLDSQVYNLARFWVIDADGLFFNRSYTWITQLIMPWSFDAVHYPFIRLRYGYALPSFLCLSGVLVLAFAWARERGDVADGLRACVGFLAMPMVVLQATTTKNDLVLAFCLFCWIEALRRYHTRPTGTRALLAALALAFLAGSKLTGLMYAAVAVAVTAWVLRRQPVDAGRLAGALALMLLLNGSWETYFNNHLQFHDWRGDPAMYEYNSNRDGWRGFVANEVRYAAGLLDLPFLPAELRERFALLKLDVSQHVLRTFHLEDRGFMSLPWRAMSEEHVARVLTSPIAVENRATFGVVGTLLTTVMPVVLLVRRRLDFPALLCLGGIGAQVLVAYTLGWHSANHRYLTAAACLAWAGMSLLLASDRHRRVSVGMTVVLATCAVAVPFTAQRSPDKLAVAFRDRNAILPRFTQEMIARIETWKQKGELPVVLAARRAPVFHVFDRLGSNVISIPNLSKGDLEKLDDVHRRGAYRIIAMGVPEPAIPNVVCEAAIPPRDLRFCLWRRR